MENIPRKTWLDLAQNETYARMSGFQKDAVLDILARNPSMNGGEAVNVVVSASKSVLGMRI